ncbi:gas vesicle protein GvpO [Priestia endophytica]|uniref:Gas vesicle synthesis protein GvpO n=1 Tax=Priestia endophytica DSM 13796 TaxID=1121089 RepID=A0A1I6APS1_9BACI|nr:gas vesicle protein GvpO [Priestia endophytica]KYG31031.1 gas vesicle protein GvpR [Priestia endophytica]SFQ70728.1 Gas vesicle synthesis protein GvpO [Priestia endophytica DSM 13796]
MSMRKILDEIHVFFEEYINPPHKVISVKPNDEGWEAFVEVLEEREYMKAYAKDELIGIYHTQVNEEMEVVSFERRSLRPRSEVIVPD